MIPHRGFESHTLRHDVGSPRRPTTPAPSTAAAPPAPDGARFAPGFVVVALLCAAPALLLSSADGSADAVVLVAAAALLVGASLAQAPVVRRGSLSETAGIAVLVATTALVIVVLLRSRWPVADHLGHVAALLVSTASVRRRWARSLIQAVTLVVVAGLLYDAAVRPEQLLVDAVVPTVLLLAITLLASALSDDLQRARRRAREARQRSATRAELLTTVRRLARHDAADAMVAATGSLRALGFDVAAAARHHDGWLVPLTADGMRWTRPVPAADERLAEVLEADRTVVFPDYATTGRRIAGLELGTVLAAPVRADGETHGLLIAARRRPGDPDPADVEILDVLAAHLGAGFATERAEQRQLELLTRLRGLEQLRGRFVQHVAEDLRDPLTVIRALTHTLAVHDGRLPEVERQQRVQQLAAQSADLAATVEALLQMSRDTPAALAAPTATALRELLDVPLEGASWGRLHVRVDAPLARRALEALRRAGFGEVHAVDVQLVDGDVRIRLDRPRTESLETRFAESVAEQLLVAAGVRWRRGDRWVELRLPRAGAEQEPPS